eukprot:scaffold2358_cov19-Tisochrysis_lutea.AAC.7
MTWPFLTAADLNSSSTTSFFKKSSSKGQCRPGVLVRDNAVFKADDLPAPLGPQDDLCMEEVDATFTPVSVLERSQLHIHTMGINGRVCIQLNANQVKAEGCHHYVGLHEAIPQKRVDIPGQKFFSATRALFS